LFKAVPFLLNRSSLSQTYFFCFQTLLLIHLREGSIF